MSGNRVGDLGAVGNVFIRNQYVESDESARFVSIIFRMNDMEKDTFKVSILESYRLH